MRLFITLAKNAAPSAANATTDAVSASPAGLLGRRRFVSAMGALALSGLPAAAAIVPAEVSATAAAETSELLARGEKLHSLIRAFRAARTHHGKALAAFLRLRPAMPDELLLSTSAERAEHWHHSDDETDLDGNVMWPPNGGPELNGRGMPCRIISADRLRANGRFNRRTKIGRLHARLLDLAERYEAGCEAASHAAGLPAATEAKYWAGYRLEKAAQELRDLPARTLEELAIKALAIVACTAIGKDEELRAIGLIGPQLAADIIEIVGAASKGGA